MLVCYDFYTTIMSAFLCWSVDLIGIFMLTDHYFNWCVKIFKILFWEFDGFQWISVIHHVNFVSLNSAVIVLIDMLFILFQGLAFIIGLLGALDIGCGIYEHFSGSTVPVVDFLSPLIVTLTMVSWFYV